MHLTTHRALSAPGQQMEMLMSHLVPPTAALKRALDKAARNRAVAKFANVTCSQCGGEFGPGDHGFSSCDGHGGIAARVRMIAAKEAFMPMVLVTVETRLAEDLNMDSLARVELSMALDDEFAVRLDSDKVVLAQTVQDCVDLVIVALAPRADQVRAEQKLVEAQLGGRA